MLEIKKRWLLFFRKSCAFLCLVLDKVTGIVQKADDFLKRVLNVVAKKYENIIVSELKLPESNLVNYGGSILDKKIIISHAGGTGTDISKLFGRH